MNNKKDAELLLLYGGLMENLKLENSRNTWLKGELKLDQIVILLIKDLKKETKLLYVIKIKIWSIKLLHRGYTKEII